MLERAGLPFIFTGKFKISHHRITTQTRWPQDKVKKQKSSCHIEDNVLVTATKHVYQKILSQFSRILIACSAILNTLLS